MLPTIRRLAVKYQILSCFVLLSQPSFADEITKSEDLDSPGSARRFTRCPNVWRIEPPEKEVFIFNAATGKVERSTEISHEQKLLRLHQLQLNWQDSIARTPEELRKRWLPTKQQYSETYANEVERLFGKQRLQTRTKSKSHQRPKTPSPKKHIVSRNESEL